LNQPLGMDNYKDLRKEQIQRWMDFFHERFEPLSHLIMIVMFVAAHFFVAQSSRTIILEPIQILWVTLGTTCFFFKLRCYDEIKDYEVDLAKNPNRPLPRGLIQHFDLKRAIENCIILEIIFFASCGLPGLVGILIAIGYSLLMYKEFFIGELIRPHLTTYATSHTVVTFLLSLAIFSAMGRFYFWNLDADFYYFALMSWLLFNIFELGRKVYQPIEERPGVDTYSSIWGKGGALALVFGHAILLSLACLYISTINFFLMQTFLGINLLLLLAIGLIFFFDTKPRSGKLIRMYSSLYIVIVYGGILFNYIERQWN